VRTVIAALVTGLFVACGGSTSTPNEDPGPAPPGTKGDTDAQAPPVIGAGPDGGAVTPDATTPPDPPPDPSEKYPADHPPMPMLTDLGGHKVISDMKLVTITFVGNTLRDQLRKFGDDVIAGPWWSAVSRGFGIHPGKGGVYAELENTLAGKTLDDVKDLQPWIAQMVAAKKLPEPDANTLFAIYFPSSTRISLDGSQSCQAFAGYHQSAKVTLANGSTVDVPYAVMPDCGGGFVSLQETASHEFIEAATDPFVSSTPTWYLYDEAWFGVDGAEDADACQRRGPFTEGNYSLARAWVNVAAAEGKDPCQRSDPGKIFFSAAPATETRHIPADPVRENDAHDSSNYITIKRGETKTVDVTIYSEAKLPHDVTVVVGKSANGQDVSKVAPIAQGVTATLDKATGKNGDKRVLTLNAASTVKTGQYVFVVRAILEQDDYHSWFVILDVQ
jgi:hypothetical protein